MVNNNQTTFSPNTPHFFKIILEETLQDNKLRIPHKFVRKYGETLSNIVSVNVPCGSDWKMRLSKNDDGKFWLKIGWPEFLKHYSIQRGDLLVFRYEGNSKFHVIICDTTTVEIDYPNVPARVSKSRIDSEPPREPEREVVEDDFVEVLDESTPRCKRVDQTPLPCSRPQKRMRTSPTGKTQCDLVRPKPEGPKTFLDKPIRKGGSKNCRTEVKGMKWKQDLPAENDSAKPKPTVRRSGRSKTTRCVKPLEGKERNAARQKARGFKSKHPFFKVVIQSSYACDRNLTIPSEFARKYLKDKSNVILKVSDGRTWSVKYAFEAHNGSSTARSRSGWKDFAQDNNLGVGDVCIFVLRNRVKILFEVLILRFSGESKEPISRALRRRATKAEIEESLTVGTKTCIVRHSQGRLPAKQGNRCKATVSKIRKNSKPKAMGKQECLNPAKKAEILERTAFESRKPFFKMVMQPTYIGAVKGYPNYMPIPLDFARNYIKNEADALLLLGKNRSWSVQLYKRRVKTGAVTPIFSVGWREFARDNNLQVGDVCVFELVDRNKISFQVFIFRAADYDMNRRHSQVKI